MILVLCACLLAVQLPGFAFACPDAPDASMAMPAQDCCNDKMLVRCTAACASLCTAVAPLMPELATAAGSKIVPNDLPIQVLASLPDRPSIPPPRRDHV